MLVDGKAIDWTWHNFTPWEMRADRGNATREEFEVLVDTRFMDAISRLRQEFGRQLLVSSYYRSPEYNATVSKTGETGPHTTGRAVDFLISGEPAYYLIGLAIRQGFTGIGVNQRGPWEKRFIHVDTLPEGPRQPRPHVWSY